MILQTQMKQMAEMVVTTVKACSGITLLSKAPMETTIVDVINALLGTECLFNLANLAGASLLLLNVKSMRLVENNPLFPAEAAEVNTTKLIIPAATGIPIKPNTSTNGLLAASSCVHGFTQRMTSIAPI